MSSYWEKRKAQRMFEAMEDAEKTAQEIAKIYSKATGYLNHQIEGVFDRYRRKYGLSEKEARKLLNDVIDEDTFDMIKKELRNGVPTEERKELLSLLESPAFRYRINRFENLQNQIDQMMESVYNQEKDLHTKHYINTAYDSYYKSIYDMQKRTGLGFSFEQIDPSWINKVLHSKWSGENYSSRIWSNTQGLAKTLKQELLVGLLTGKTEREISEIITNKFLVGSSQSRRLVRTESNYIATEADMMAYEESGVEKYIFIATLDLITSKVCRSLDGEIFDVKKRETGVNCPPMHPWCRSTTIEDIDEDVLANMKRRARDPKTGKTYLVPANMKYDEWLKSHQFPKNNDISNLKNKHIVRENNRHWQEENKKMEIGENNRKLDVLPSIFKYPEIKEDNLLSIFSQINKKYISDGYEHLAIADRKTGELLGDIMTSKSSKTVNPTEEMADFIMNAKKKSLISIHNHPNKHTFSIGDIITTNNIPSFGEAIVINSSNEIYYFSIPEGKEIDLSTEDLQDKFKYDILNIRKKCRELFPNYTTNDIDYLAFNIKFKELGWIYGRKKY